MGFEDVMREFLEAEKKKVKAKERLVEHGRKELILLRRELKTKERGYMMLTGKPKKQSIVKEETKQEQPKS